MTDPDEMAEFFDQWPETPKVERDEVLMAKVRDQYRDLGMDEDQIAEAIGVARDAGMFDVRGQGDAMTETWTPGATIYHCPLSKCDWHYRLPEGDEWRNIQAPEPETLRWAPGTPATDVIAAVDRQRMLAVESILSAHLATHTTPEWVTEISRLNGIMAAVARNLADDGRIGHSLLTGAMATRANLAREECLDLLVPGHDPATP